MKIGILGCGVIGSAIAAAHEGFGQEVIRHDLRLGTRLEDILSCNLIFVCLPTPQAADGSCDLTVIRTEIDNLCRLDYRGIVVMKSTVPPGTGRGLLENAHFLYVSCPEFLREHNALGDYLNQRVHIVGSDCPLPPEVTLCLKPLGSSLMRVSLEEAELAKYFHNTYNAWRVVFANAFNDLSDAYFADYSKILSVVSKLTDIREDYLRSNKELRGFGGPCLPKDTAALAYLARIRGLRSNVWEICLRENEKWDTTLIPGMRSTGASSNSGS